MKILFYLILGTVFYLMIAETSIQFKPFKITVDHHLKAIGWCILIVGMSLISYSHQKQAKQEARKEMLEIMEEIKQWRNPEI